MTRFYTELPDVLRAAGIDVYELPGCRTRGASGRGFDLDAIIWHHTATGPNWQDGHVAALLRDGRRDLSGPLSQVGIERDGTWVIVACGRANHNGYGKHGNSSLGLEFYNSGTGELWPAAQVESGIRGIAAIRNHYGDVPVLGHKESDPNRKVDPFGLDMNRIRTRIEEAQEADMPLSNEDVQKVANAVWARTLTYKGAGLTAPAELAIGDIFHHARLGAVAQPVSSDVTVDEQAIAREILTHLDPAKIAAAIPDGLAEKVADKLAERLAS